MTTGVAWEARSNHLIIDITSDSFLITFVGSITTIPASDILEAWQQIAISYDFTLGQFYRNNSALGSSWQPDEYFVDEAANDKVIGSTSISMFIWQFCLFQKVMTSFDVVHPANHGDNFCDACPTCDDECAEGSVRLSTCEYTNASLDGNCESCLDGCVTGCTRTTDCRNCLEDLCATCGVYDICDACITGASEDDTGVCQCKTGFTYLFDVDICDVCIPGCEICDMSTTCIQCQERHFLTDDETCVECHEYCQVCFDTDNHSCTECTTGNYLIPNTTTCFPYCPSGLTLDSENNVCIEQGTETLCFDLSDKVLGAEIYSVYLEETTDVIPIYQRGFYFDGNDKLKVKGLVINTTFTLEYWIRSESFDCALMRVTYPQTEVLVFGMSLGELFQLIGQNMWFAGSVTRNEWI